MIIGIASYKGGVGKTSFAFSIAKDLNYKYITNDSSIVPSIYKKAKYVPKKMTIQEDTVFDFGGFQNEHTKEILEQVDVILIPTTLDSNSIMKTVQVYREYKEKKIFIIANMIESSKEAKKILKLITKYMPNINILFFRRAKLLKNALESGLSATELFEANGKNRHIYRNAFSDYSKILSILKKPFSEIQNIEIKYTQEDNEVLLEGMN